MITNNFAAYGLKIIVELLGDILYFPIWWYSRGLINTVKSLINFISDKQKAWALLVWVKNIFKPMYAQSDWQGILISIFMRIVQIIFRSIVMLFWLIVAIAWLIFWITLPLLVFFEILFQSNLF